MHHTQSPDTSLSDKVCSARPLAGNSSVAPVFVADISLLDSCNRSTITSNSLGDSRFQSCDFKSHFLSNQQFSITAVTTSTGSVAERYAYTAYGQPTFLDASGTPLTTQTSTLNARYLYTGREWDATLGLYHFRARWMSGVAGRFLARDPIGYRGGIGLYVVYFVPSKKDPYGNRAVLDDGPSVTTDNRFPGTCVHNTQGKKRCFFAVKTASDKDKTDDILGDMGDDGVSGQQPDCGPFDASPAGKRKILQIIKDHMCCEIIFAGHQGGSLNVGGVCSKDEQGTPTPLLPDDEFEAQLRIIMMKNCSSGCDVFQYSCGGSDPKNEAPKIQQDIANDIGCTFWATKRGENYPIQFDEKRFDGCPRTFSFDPSDWEPNIQKKWCLPFPMDKYTPVKK